MRSILSVLFVLTLFSCTPYKASEDSPAKSGPNILILYVDDLGFGDIGIYGAKGVETPHVDALAAEGVRFTDGHCSAATCTPSRYALLTGQYAFRNNAAILPGDAPLLIDTARQTLPKMLKAAGYYTGVVGKWHLGLGYGQVDWNETITPGPSAVGFDYSYLIPATGDRVPTVFVENGDVVGLEADDPLSISYSERIGSDPIGLEIPDQLKMKADSQHSQAVVNGISRIGYMKGGHHAWWVDEEFPDVLTGRARHFLDQAGDKPFFLYFSFHDIHVPRAPNDRFKGASTMGPRGDAIAQMDWVVGQLVEELKSRDKLENTLIIFTSDNGPVLDDGYQDQAVELLGNHQPAGRFKGGKYSAYEGGTRVPTIVYWPGHVSPGVSDAMLTQVDLMASLAKLAGGKLTDQDIDSRNFLDAWLGKSAKGRQVMIEESFTKSLRMNDLKYISPFEGATPEWLKNKDVATGLQDTPQLYDLSQDPSESINLYDSLPDKALEMQKELDKIVASGQP